MIMLGYGAAVDGRIPAWLGAATPIVAVLVWAVLLDLALAPRWVAVKPQVKPPVSGSTGDKPSLFSDH